MTVKTITIELEPNDRTDVLCVVCNRFTTRERGRSFVFARGSGDHGLHAKCAPNLKRQKRSRTRVPTDPGAYLDGEPSGGPL